jgi:hypothetical protein
MSKYITDDEYISKDAYVMDYCRQPDYAATPDAKPTPKPAEDIAECESKKRAEILLRRSVTTKENVIGGLIWGSIAFVLFLTHFPVMIKNK